MINSIRYFNEESIYVFEKLEKSFWENPLKFAELVIGVTKEVHKLGLRIIKECLEDTDQLVRDSVVRKKRWYVDRNETKSLITSLGTVTFTKTLYKNKKTGERTYLLDRVMGLEEHERITEDAEAKLLEEAVQTSYRRGGEAASIEDDVTKQTVKKKIHSLQFPIDQTVPKEKKVVDYLYLEADEDHVSLQFKEKKGDLEQNDFGYKNNCLISKLVYVHEGIQPESIIENETGEQKSSKRSELINPHYFGRICAGKENEQFWDEIYSWICNHYDISKIKRIYLNADGGSWIQSAVKRIGGLTYALDEFHLQKYIMKLTSHMKDSTTDARKEIYEAIRKNSRKEFKAITERLKECLETEAGIKRIEDSRDYILNNWEPARVRVNRETGIIGSSTEGHVYHVLSVRMSTRPMGWSKVGAAKMTELRVYYLNGGDMLELVRSQKKELPKVAGAEEVILHANEIIQSERNKHAELGKYVESITHEVSDEIKKEYWYKGLMGKLL